MNVKVRILLSICILTILGAIFIVGDLVNEVHHDPEYTAQSSAVYTDEYGVFFMENWNDQGRIYRVDQSGDVLAMAASGSMNMDRGEKLTFFNGRLYVLFSSGRTDQDGTYITYRIAAYDQDLDAIGVTELFTIDRSLSVCSITADSMDIYISALSGNGADVTVFDIPVRLIQNMDSLEKDESEKKGNDGELTRADFLTPDGVLHRERTSERFFVDARYIGSELFVLLDGDIPDGLFAPDSRIKAAVDAIHFTAGQKARLHSALIIRIVGMMVIWMIVVILTVRLTRDRDRIVYLYSASEVALFLILFIAFFFIKTQLHKNEIRNNTKFAMMIMQDDMKYYSGVDYDAENFFDSTKYYRLMDSLTDVLNENGETEVFHDAFIMRKSSGMVLADARGYTGIHASYLYGGDMSTLIDELKEELGTVSVSFDLEGVDYTAIAYSSENPNDDIALVVLCKDRSSSESYKASVRGLGILFIVIFIVGSIVLFIALYLQHMDLKRFSVALKGLALEDKKVESPKIVARDMRELWQCYGELSKKIELINYEKYRIFEAYYRFAPKGIEKIMGRGSIFDVENGDVATVPGAIILLTVDKSIEFENRVRSLSRLLSNMEKYAAQNDAILVSRDQSLSNVRFLLLKEKSDMVSQIVQFVHSTELMGMSGSGWSVLMYKDVLTYGVAGSRMQSLTYIDSEYSRKLNSYAAWFRKLGVPLVVTDRIIKTEDVGEKRYIGCAGFDGEGNELHFYEILDAYPAGIRQVMLINREKFEETLELFYSKDFYLARNQFMDILKDCPQDGIAKWYVFECERYMNEDADISRSQYIQIGDRD